MEKNYAVQVVKALRNIDGVDGVVKALRNIDGESLDVK